MNRTRLEQRFLEENSRNAWRLREMVKFISPLAKNTGFSVVGSNELFWNFTDFVPQKNKKFDQNRLFMGLGYQLNKGLTLEIGYLNQFIYRPNAPNFLANVLLTYVYGNFD